MERRRRVIFQLILILLILAAIAMFFCSFIFVDRIWGQMVIPTYDGYVNDFANVIPDDLEPALEAKIDAHEKETTNEIAVVTIKTTQPEDIDQYSIQLAEAWKVGKDGKDNGVILLFAMDDRMMRIEVGRGLEGDLTDIESKDIIEDTITPEFKKAEYATGVDKGVDAVIVAIKTETVAPKHNDKPFPWIPLGIFGTIFGLIALAVSRFTPLGGEGDNHVRGVWVPKKGSRWGEGSFGKINNTYTVPILPSFGGSSSSSSSYSSPSVTFGGGSFSGGGAKGGW